jgi:hypothetical protein
MKARLRACSLHRVVQLIFNVVYHLQLLDCPYDPHLIR